MDIRGFGFVLMKYVLLRKNDIAKYVGYSINTEIFFLPMVTLVTANNVHQLRTVNGAEYLSSGCSSGGVFNIRS